LIENKGIIKHEKKKRTNNDKKGKTHAKHPDPEAVLNYYHDSDHH